MNLFLLALFTIWVITAAVYDLTQKRLPNWLIATAIVLYLINYIVDGGTKRLPSNWVVTATAFAFALLLLALNLWGAGDTKFILVMFLWYPSPVLAMFILVILLVTQLGILIYKRVSKKALNKATVPLIPFLSIGWVTWVAWIIMSKA